WKPRASRKTKRFTCPNCNYSFVLSSDVTTTTTATTTTTTAITTTESVRELFKLSTGHRLFEVRISSYVVRFLCTEDLSACDSSDVPDDLPDEVLVKALELLYGARLRIVESSRSGLVLGFEG
ncbi:MAG: hypothetical protein GXO32_01090, partial [Crenarchaeota archaeon]|nr:hypothetical protein [Thermoproteota archaeon]